jgi:hypothetical protein
MKTFADLKRDLQVGRSLTLTFSGVGKHKYLDVPRFVVKIQSNGVYLNEDKDATTGSFLDLPRASQVEYFEDGRLNVYEVGKRDLTEEEKSIINNCPSKMPENAERCKIDMLTDGSSMYWADKRYFVSKGREDLLHIYKEVIKDNRIKGRLILSYVVK